MCIFVVELGCLVGVGGARFVVFEVFAQLCVVGDVFGERLCVYVNWSSLWRWWWWWWGLGTDLAAGESGFEFGPLLGDLCALELELFAVDEVASGGGKW